MDTHEPQVSWIERVEDLIHMLEGTSIGELELTEAGTEIIIRRQPGMMLVSSPAPVQYMAAAGLSMAPVATGPAVKEDKSFAVVTPMTGVYYSAPSPTLPPFVSIGDIVHAGQIVALVEAMKVFNEIQAPISGRVIALVATNGEVVQKDDVLIRVVPV
jgi:acetyl-CoA carboxylase biotin carboxyl carrier protein